MEYQRLPNKVWNVHRFTQKLEIEKFVVFLGMVVQNKFCRLIFLKKVPYDTALFSISDKGRKNQAYQIQLGSLVFSRANYKNMNFEYDGTKSKMLP